MNDKLFPYYERELIFIRQLAQEFARQYPAAAGRLLLEPNRSADPHVERLIEAFALLSARIHNKLDDEFPELTDGLLSILYPHYLRPIPSFAIVQFDLDPTRAQLPKGFLIHRNSQLATPPIGGVSCKFRTSYPVTLWPLQLTHATFQTPPYPSGLVAPPRTAAVLRLQFECMGQVKLSQLSLEALRLFLYGDNQLVGSLYESLFNHTIQVVIRPLDTNAPPVVLKPEECLGQVGFDKEHALLPFPERSFSGYRLLTEYFAFRSKFWFVDVGGWQQARQNGFGRKCEVAIFFNRTVRSLEQGVDASTFRLGCAPAVNLFDQVAEPIAVTHARHEYRVVPNVAFPDGMEVYSIDSVSSTDPATNQTTEFRPFYSFRHGTTQDNQQTFWYASRRRPPKTEGSDVFITLVDLNFNPSVPAESTLVVRTTCSNRNLPKQLQLAGDALNFELEAAAPVNRVRCIRVPTTPMRPANRRGGYWRLVSPLSLNHLSISGDQEGAEALREILRLYDCSEAEAGQEQLSAVNQQIIDGVVSVSSRRVIGRVGSEIASGFCRGVEVTVELDEQKYIGAGLFLFASVLERFLGMYASINSFSQLVAKSKQGESVIKRWPPRAGEIQLL